MFASLFNKTATKKKESQLSKIRQTRKAEEAEEKKATEEKEETKKKQSPAKQSKEEPKASKKRKQPSADQEAETEAQSSNKRVKRIEVDNEGLENDGEQPAAEDGSGDSDDQSLLEFGSDEGSEDEALQEKLRRIVQGLDVSMSEESGDEDDAPATKNNAKEESGADDETQRHQRTVFVSNLHKDVTSMELRTEFAQYGPAVAARLIPAKGGSNVASALVEFKRPAGAKKAIQLGNGVNFKGRKLVVASSSKGSEESEPSAQAPSKSTKDNKKQKVEKQKQRDEAASQPTSTNEEGQTIYSLYIRNLSFKTSEDALRAEFSKCGDIASVRLPVFEDTGKPRGYGFIDFTEESARKKALKMNRVVLDERQLLMEVAKPNKDK